MPGSSVSSLPPTPGCRGNGAAPWNRRLRNLTGTVQHLAANDGRLSNPKIWFLPATAVAISRHGSQHVRRNAAELCCVGFCRSSRFNCINFAGPLNLIAMSRGLFGDHLVTRSVGTRQPSRSPSTRRCLYLSTGQVCHLCSVPCTSVIGFEPFSLVRSLHYQAKEQGSCTICIASDVV